MSATKEQIIDRLNLNGLSAEKQNEAIEQIEKLIQKKIRIAILSDLHANDLKKLALLENSSDQSILAFLSNLIPDFKTYIAQISKLVINDLAFK